MIVNPKAANGGTATTIQEGIDMASPGGKVLVLTIEAPAAAPVRGEHVDGSRPEALGRERLAVGDASLVARL